MSMTADNRGKGRRSEESLSFSVVICTDGRANSLRNTLRSLEYLEYENFEVCVVYGPTADGVQQILAEYNGRIKVASNPVRNLSISRNIGIALASGQIVAFIDDDALPEPEWLRDLAAGYADPRIAGVGGFVYDHVGTQFHYRYSTVNRLGHHSHQQYPTPELCFPLTASFPHLLGTNSSFRRDALLELAGFDEEYEYYLDETDVMVRLIDAGKALTIVDGAYVHHKFLPSSIRDVDQKTVVLRHWYPIIKNKLYFALRHAQRHYDLHAIIDDTRQFVADRAREVDEAINQGHLTEWDREQFWKQANQAWRDGLNRGFASDSRLLTQETLSRWSSPFLPFNAAVPEGGRRTFCFVSQEYSPGKMGGVGRYTHELTSAIAAMGHHVYVLTKAEGYDRIDFEDGVWVHQLVDRPTQSAQPSGLKMPSYLWSRAMTVAQEVDAIATKRTVDAVSAPIWDCEGIGVLERYPLVTVLLTSMKPWVSTNPSLSNDRTFMRTVAQPMIAAETYLMRRSDGVIASTKAIVDEMKQFYGVQFESSRLSLVPYGLGDWTRLPRELPPSLPPGSLRLLFVGRLEERKGIDVLLNCAKRVLARYPNVFLDVVGNDTIPGPKGRTWRQFFEADPKAMPVRERVRFHGAVSDERLRGFYSACDIFVAPSRFESFGLILVEGMMFSKPVVGCSAGGMVEVVENGVSGLLAEPGDEVSLEAALVRLITDADLRARLGAEARATYEQRFTAERMAAEHLAALKAVAIEESAEARVRSLGA